MLVIQLAAVFLPVGIRDCHSKKQDVESDVATFPLEKMIGWFHLEILVVYLDLGREFNFQDTLVSYPESLMALPKM